MKIGRTRAICLVPNKGSPDASIGVFPNGLAPLVLSRGKPRGIEPVFRLRSDEIKIKIFISLGSTLLTTSLSLDEINFTFFDAEYGN